MTHDQWRSEELQLKRRLAKIQLERALERRVTKAKWDRWVFTPLMGLFAMLGVVAVMAVVLMIFGPQESMQPTRVGPPLAPVTTTPTPTPPYQPESDVDRFLRHAHVLGIQHHQGDGALVATGMRICDAVRKGTPIPSVVLGFTEVFVVQGGVNQKDADAFAWYALGDLCEADLYAALPPGGYCVEGGFWNGTTQECMSDHPTQSPPGATVTLPTSSVTPTPPYGDCTNGDDCHGGTYTPSPTRG